MYPASLIYFSIFILSVVYLLASVLSGSFKKVHFPQMAVYISAVALIGVSGELFIGGLYETIAGTPLWQYKVLPIHNGHTSYYSLVIWGIYGFYLYLHHSTLAKWGIKTTRHLALIFSVEAIIFEVIINLLFRAFFGHYIFYYLPGDLWHITSLQAIPFYFLAGVVIVKSIKRFKTDPWFFAVMNTLLVTVLLFY